MSDSAWQPVRLLDVAPAAIKEVEAEDPLELVGVGYPSNPDADRFTARCIVEEYAMIGFGAGDIRALFTSPNYVALYSMYRRYGPGFVDESIAAVFPPEELD